MEGVGSIPIILIYENIWEVEAVLEVEKAVWQPCGSSFVFNVLCADKRMTRTTRANLAPAATGVHAKCFIRLSDS